MTSEFASRRHQQLHLAYREELSPARAIKAARRTGRWLRSARLSCDQLDRAFDEVSLACEALWDLWSTDEAVRIATVWFRAVERVRDKDPDAVRRGLRDAQAHRLLARALHRAKSQDAWHHVCCAYDRLCDMAGGPKTLSALVRSDPYGEISATYALLLGIAIPAARRRKGAEDRGLGERFLGDALAFAHRFATDRDHDVRRYHAVVAMLFHAVCARKRPQDRSLVDLLLLLDDRARPRDQRGEVTRFVVWAAYCAYLGDDAEAERFERLSTEALLTAEMYRHVTELRLHRAA